MPDLIDTLAQRLDAQVRNDRRYHADCPFCGKEAKRAQKHFSFVDAGYKCWVCDASGSLARLASHLAISAPVAATPRPVRPARPVPARPWQQQTEAYLRRFGEALDRVPAWESYKPLDLDTIARFRLGVGVLPSSRCQHRRLIVPVFDGDRVVAFHGRAFLPGDDDAKWLTSGGSRKDVLYNAQLLRPGAFVIIAENMIDCLLAMQCDPTCVAISSGGVNWRDEWTAQIAASRPEQVLVWLDNDLVGNPNQRTYRALAAQWRRERQIEPPEPRGPKIANDLLAAGLNARCYQWPASTPAKYDLGSALMAEMAVA